MIVLGKTQTVEFAYGGWGTNPVWARRGTPGTLHPSRAGRLLERLGRRGRGRPRAGRLGSDTGGSVRTPACFCGLVGLKTSPRVIGRGGVFPLAPSLDTVGPLARSVPTPPCCSRRWPDPTAR